MKVIFLDIDGVLNNEKHIKQIHDLVHKRKLPLAMIKGAYFPYSDTILPLKKIVDETNAKIVLSSDWKNLKGRKESLKQIFERYGLKIFDETPNGVDLNELNKIGFDKNKCCDAIYRNIWHTSFFDKTTKDTGAEIAYWLSKHPEVETFVILDDDFLDIEPYYTKEHVQTNRFEEGLTYELANKAIQILNGGK